MASSSAVMALLLVSVAIVSAKVQMLGDEPQGLDLGEGAQVHMKTTAKEGVTVKRMWTRAEQSELPADTQTYKTVRDVDPHGKCRGICYGDKLCAGYAYTPAHKTCKLLAPPSFLADAKGNDMWHKAASYDHTGADYEEDKAAKKEEKNLDEGLKQMPKRPPAADSPPPQSGPDGHLDLQLTKMMNQALQEAEATEGGDQDVVNTENEGLMEEGMSQEVARYRTRLYQEFYETNAHDYEARAEACAVRKANKITKKRIKSHNIRHPKKPLENHEKDDMYHQARKEVNNHCIRKMQKKFQDSITLWASDELYQRQERMKNDADQKKQAAEEAKAKNDAAAQKAILEGKEPPAAVEPDDPTM
jgi:hypothetical protein